MASLLSLLGNGSVNTFPWQLIQARIEELLNSDLHRNLNIESVIDIINKTAQNHEWGLHNHLNTKAIQLLNYREATRRLNRAKPLELCSARSDPS
jgi:hypothetical protein